MSRAVIYQSEKISIPLAVLFLVFMGILMLRMYMVGPNYFHLGFGMFFLLVYSLTFSQSVIVDDYDLHFSYGFGLITSTYQKSSLESPKVVKNSHFLTWLYDPFSTEVVCITVRQCGKIYLPSTEPARLMAALRSR